MRLSKTVDGVEYTYLYKDGLLVQETRGTKVFNYSYDANGKISMVVYKANESATEETYYYALNSRGDVIGIYTYTGKLFAKYSYDVWGNLLSITNQSGGNLAHFDNIATLQPFRYRSYYYDTDSGFYYLQSRYYDPVTHRFINGDSLMDESDLLGYNLFAYCNNNPIISSDPLGLCSKAWSYGIQGPCPGQGKPGCMDNWLRDVSDEVDAALIPAAENNSGLRSSLYASSFNIDNGSVILNELIMYTNFYFQVDHEAPWDIKREEPWENTIGTPYPGFNTIIIYHDSLTTVEEMGNYTYGYLGYYSQIPLNVLFIGSYIAAGAPKKGDDLRNELGDWIPIVRGYSDAKKKFK